MRIEDGFDGLFACMKEEEVARGGGGLETSEFRVENIQELRLSMVCVSWDGRGQILKETATKIKVAVVLLPRYPGHDAKRE